MPRPARSTANVPRIVLAAIGCGTLLVPIAMQPRTGRDDPEPPTTVHETCVTERCHATVGQVAVVHGPVAQRKCQACHVYDEPREHRFVLARPAEALCTTCHVVSHRTYVHEPVQTGNCTGCHDPHGSDHPFILVADPTEALCRSCHPDTDGNGHAAFVHGPVAAGACIVCHDAHSAWEADLLVEPLPQLCYECHVEIMPDAVEDRYRHPPFEDDCLACHDVHASDTRAQLHEDAPELCLGCHEETRLELAGGGMIHGALTEPGGCLACHAPHASRLPALRRQSDIALCLGCHDHQIVATDGRRLPDILALLQFNPSHHGPIRQGMCSTCHEPHVAEHPQLLQSEYPPEFYAAFTMERYELCFGCHIPALVESPDGFGLTGFRTEEVNLHWLHVNREKGRTCRACHEVHASRNPFHISDTVPFGDWTMDIAYEKTVSGGSCAPGCHERLSYDRGGT